MPGEPDAPPQASALHTVAHHAGKAAAAVRARLDAAARRRHAAAHRPLPVAGLGARTAAADVVFALRATGGAPAADAWLDALALTQFAFLRALADLRATDDALRH